MMRDMLPILPVSLVGLSQDQPDVSSLEIFKSPQTGNAG